MSCLTTSFLLLSATLVQIHNAEVAGLPNPSLKRTSEDTNDGGEEDVAAVNLDENNFKSLVGDSPHFVMFFVPWCGTCKELAPVWEALAAKHNKDADSKVTLAKVDCTVATSLC